MGKKKSNKKTVIDVKQLFVQLKEDGIEISADILTRAKKGDGAALYEISKKYEYCDEQLAMKWCRLSAEKNYGEALYYLGEYSHIGLCGLAQNQFIAMEWYLRAASQKEFLAYEKIAELFEYGEKGIMTDDKKSLEWHYRWNPNSEQVKMLQKEGYTLTKAERDKTIDELIAESWQVLDAKKKSVKEIRARNALKSKEELMEEEIERMQRLMVKQGIDFFTKDHYKKLLGYADTIPEESIKASKEAVKAQNYGQKYPKNQQHRFKETGENLRRLQLEEHKNHHHHHYHNHSHSHTHHAAPPEDDDSGDDDELEEEEVHDDDLSEDYEDCSDEYTDISDDYTDLSDDDYPPPVRKPIPMSQKEREQQKKLKQQKLDQQKKLEQQKKQQEQRRLQQEAIQKQQKQLIEKQKLLQQEKQKQQQRDLLQQQKQKLEQEKLQLQQERQQLLLQQQQQQAKKTVNPPKKPKDTNNHHHHQQQHVTKEEFDSDYEDDLPECTCGRLHREQEQLRNIKKRERERAEALQKEKSNFEKELETIDWLIANSNIAKK